MYRVTWLDEFKDKKKIREQYFKTFYEAKILYDELVYEFTPFKSIDKRGDVIESAVMS